METPQMFEADLLRSAYQSLISNKENVTDEASAMELIGVKTKLVANESPNLKITYPEDIPLAEHLLSFLS